ncbi:MAG: MarR family transcriptional regulator [Opitutaceae bacterium]|nr:MarR family transcriptional regulator [Opitutaceae bacterium]
MTSTRTKSALSKADYELLAEFRYALRVFLGFSERAARAHGLQPQQYQALLAIEGFPGRNWVTIGELAERLQVAHHSAVGLVDRLETLRLAKRAASDEDRRKVVVSLTRAGRTILEKLYRVHRAELQSAGPKIAALLQKASRKLPDESAGS